MLDFFKINVIICAVKKRGINMSTLFSRSENDLAKAFMNDIKNKKYIEKPNELNSNKSKHLYDSFIDLTIKSEPKEFYQTDFIKLTKDEVFEAFIYSIFTIFGDTEEIKKEMECFCKRIQLSNDNEILSGVNLAFRDEITKKIECVVEIPSVSNTSSVISLVHEFIHFHMSNKEIDLNKKYYYTEIFSILGEKIAACIVEENLKYQNDMTQKIENTRLSGIVWHYKDRLEEMTTLQKIYNNAKKGFVPASMSIEEMEKECPWLKGSSIKESYNIFRDNLAYSYGFGYIYAENLFRKFLKDQEKTTYDINEVLNGKTRIDSLLRNYNIGINQQSITTAKQKVKSITK